MVARSTAHPPARHRAGMVYLGIDLSKLPVPPEPHPEMTAGTRDMHRELVRDAVPGIGPDVDALSAITCLPAWNVRRALFALGLGPDPSPAAGKAMAKYGARIVRAAKWLRRHGPATTVEVARASGLAAQGCGRVLKGRPHPCAAWSISGDTVTASRSSCGPWRRRPVNCEAWLAVALAVALMYGVVAVAVISLSDSVRYQPIEVAVARAILWPLVLARLVAVEAYRVIRHG